MVFPSGVMVTLYRNFYGINVVLKTPRAKVASGENGLCLYDGQSDIDKYGYNFR